MNHPEKFAVIGGDLRMIYAAKFLHAQGFSPMLYGFSEGAGALSCAASLALALRDAAYVLLPVPYSRDGEHLFAPLCAEKIPVRLLLETAAPDARIFAGGAIPTDARVCDYAAREEFAIRNAVPTAEGALACIMEALPVTVRGLRVCVTGFGRVGCAVASLLRAAGAEVTVFARSAAARAKAEAEGHRALPLALLRVEAGGFRCLVNTVPAPIFDGETLGAIAENALLLDLASVPNGTEAMPHRCRVQKALSLPGKVAPETAGEIIGKTVFGLLSEKDGGESAP